MSDADDDDLPDWVKDQRSQQLSQQSPLVVAAKGRAAGRARAPVLDDSDDDLQVLPSPQKATDPAQAAPAPADAVHAAAEEAGPSRTTGRSPHAKAQQGRPHAASGPSHAEVGAADDRAAAPAAAAAAPPPEAESLTQGDASHAHGACQRTAGAAVEGSHAVASSSGTAGPKGEVVIMMSDKVPATKVLLELRASGQSEAPDLAGDAGAVGRIVRSNGHEDAFQIDLKGVLYNTSVLRLAGTAMVLNIGAAEAKVEAVMHDFVRLQEDFSMGVETVEGNVGDLLGSDDEEVYQVAEDGAPADGQAAAGDKDKGGKKAAGKKKAGAAGGKGLAKSSISGGVKKVKKAGAKKAGKAGAKGAGKGKAVAKVKKAPAKAKGEAKAKAKGEGGKDKGKAQAGGKAGQAGKGAKEGAGKAPAAAAKKKPRKKKDASSEEEDDDDMDTSEEEQSSSEDEDDEDFEA